jgi:hypothetical protein
VQFLPITWASVIADTSFKDDLLACTLPTCASARGFLNHVAVDTMFFMSPHFHRLIVARVVTEVNRVVALFCAHNPRFDKNNVSIMGHSLGSVIASDILTRAPVTPSSSLSSSSSSSAADAADALAFPVLNFFAVGSPAGLFYAVRGNSVSLADPAFTLAACERVYK